MLGLRQKLSLGFGGLLLILLIIGIQSIVHLTNLGESIDVILRENYRSVIACQQMKEALERMDSGILFELLGYTEKGDEFIRKNVIAVYRFNNRNKIVRLDIYEQARDSGQWIVEAARSAQAASS